mmetsp:Transcript_8213/g.26985  ORF Transcript_8213/g.26985 Transcript_8213/m.26985 type:complete len:310 (-) Transcript_8213:2010-2939(-)
MGLGSRVSWGGPSPLDVLQEIFKCVVRREEARRGAVVARCQRRQSKVHGPRRVIVVFVFVVVVVEDGRFAVPPPRVAVWRFAANSKDAGVDKVEEHGERFDLVDFGREAEPGAVVDDCARRLADAEERVHEDDASHGRAHGRPRRRGAVAPHCCRVEHVTPHPRRIGVVRRRHGVQSLVVCAPQSLRRRPRTPAVVPDCVRVYPQRGRVRRGPRPRQSAALLRHWQTGRLAPVVGDDCQSAAARAREEHGHVAALRQKARVDVNRRLVARRRRRKGLVGLRGLSKRVEEAAGAESAATEEARNFVVRCV